MDEILEQVRVLTLRQVQLNATKGGEHPPPIPAKLITPLMTRVLSFQLPEVIAGLDMIEAYLLDLCEAGSLTIAELIDELRSCPTVFDPVSKAYIAARQFCLSVLAKALALAENATSTSPSLWEGLHPHHLAFILEGLMTTLPFGEFADCTSELSGSISEFSSTSMPVLIKKAPGFAALEQSLTLLSKRHLVALVTLVLDRLGEKTAASTGSGAISGMLSSAFHIGGTSALKWSAQATLLIAIATWHFSLLDSEKQEATCRLLQAVWDTVIPEVQRSSQKRVILTTLTEIWRSLSREVCASPRAVAAWKDLLGPEPKLLGALFELQEHFFSTAQKWIRKQKIRNEALVLLQVLLCHGRPEFFKSKHRGFFVTALVAACNDSSSRSGALPTVAAYLEQTPDAFVAQIREVWKAEVLTLIAAAFPRRAACQPTELKALTDSLTAVARTDLKLAVTSIQSLLTSTRHHTTQKVVALRAVRALMNKNTPTEILDLDSTLLPTILGCVADKTELSLAVEALGCLPPVWSLLPLIRSAAIAEPDKASKGQSTVHPAVQSKEECMDAIEELSRAADRSISTAAIKVLREISPLLSASELLRALQIHSRTTTSDLQASVETWTASLEDGQSILSRLKLSIEAASAEVCTSPERSGSAEVLIHPSEAQNPSTGALIPQAQWCKARLKVEGLSLLGLMHPDQRVWEKARAVLTSLNDATFRSMEAAPEATRASGKAQPRCSAPEAVLRQFQESEIEQVETAGIPEEVDSVTLLGSRTPEERLESGGQTVSMPFLADALLVGQSQGLDAEVWERRSSAVGVVWAPELWPLLVRQSERYSLCIEWAWSRVRKHRAEQANLTQDRSRVLGDDTSSRLAAASGVEDTSEHSVQLQRNHVYFLCLCVRETLHPELDLDEAAKGRKRQVFQWADVAAKPGLPLMTSKGVTGRKAARADDNARVWLKKRRMTRAAVRECLQQVWEQIQSVYEGVAGDETAQLLLCVDAIHPSCHEDLILELKRYQTQQRLGPTPLSPTSSGAVTSGSNSRKLTTPGSPTKRNDGTFEFQSAGTSDFYYQENVLYVLAGLYARTSPEEYRSAPTPVRSALEEFVGAWSREQDLSGFAGLSLKVRMYAVRIIELYLLYTTAAVQAAVAHTGASGADRAEQEAAFVPSLAYRTNMFRCLTMKWSHGLAPTSSAAGSSNKADANDDPRRKSSSAGRGSERPSSLDDAIARAIAALISMGPLKDRDFENTLLRYLQTYHAKGSPSVRARVVETMAVFLKHNPHRVRSFIAGSFAQLHRVLEKEEAAALALTYFKALARSVETELEEWLTVRGLHPAKITHLCLLHMTSTGESFRHVALELLATLETVAERPAPLLQGVLPANNDAPPEIYMAAAVTTSVHLAAAHPEYTVAMIKEALSLQQILPKDVISTILTLLQPWACNFSAVLEEENRAADLAAVQLESAPAEVVDQGLGEVFEPSPRARTLVERMPNLQNLRSSYTEEEEELTSPLPASFAASAEAERRGSTEKGLVSGSQTQAGSARKASTEPSSPGRKQRTGSGWKDDNGPGRKASLEATLSGKEAALGSGQKAETDSVRKGRPGADAKVAPEPIGKNLLEPNSSERGSTSGSGEQHSSGSVRKGSAEGLSKQSEGDRKADVAAKMTPSRSVIRRGLERTFSDVSITSSTDFSTVSRGTEDSPGISGRTTRKGSAAEPEPKPMSPSEQSLLCLFQITRTCAWPPAHPHLLRGVWQGLLSAPPAEKEGVAAYVADFLLLCHMSRAETPETAYLPQGSKRQSGNDAPGRKAAGVGLDQRLAKLLLGYLLETDCGEVVLQRLVHGVRSYTMDTFASGNGRLHIAWERAGQFTPEPVGQKEHSALILLADAAYHQETLLVPHLPELLHMAIVLLRPRAEHVWAHRAAGSFHLCLESHSLIAHLLHSLAVRYAPSNLARERAQTFLDTYYSREAEQSKEAGDRSKADAQRASYDPEERLTTSYLFELISLLQPFRPELRPEWAERALSWAAGALDKRVVIDSLRVFAVVNKSLEVGTLVKVERLLLGAARTRDYAVADSILDVFAKAVTRLCRQDPSRSIDSEIIAPRGAWEHVTAAALIAMSWTNVRMFHKALTMAQVMIEARPEGSCDSALDEFWRVQGGPLDETIYELLFPGLLNEKTALGTLSLLETLAKAHVIALPADNKLTVLVLLLNTALVHSGQTQRCEEALRIVDSAGCALADLSAIFTAQMLGKYKIVGPRPALNPESPRPTSPRKQRTTSYTYGQKDRGHVSPPASPSAITSNECGAKSGASRTRSDANGATEEATRTRRRPRRHAFLEEFFNAFSLAFPSEYTWTFSLHSLLSLIGRGPPSWRAPLTDVLSSLLHARAHAWTESHFQAVADVIADVATAEQQTGEVKRSQARGDIRALLRDHAPPAIAQRVFDAIRPIEVAKEKPSPPDPRLSLTLPPGKRQPGAPTTVQTPMDAPADFFSGYPAGSDEANARLRRAERWLEALEAKHRRQIDLKRSLLQGTDLELDIAGSKMILEVISLNPGHQTSSSRSLPPNQSREPLAPEARSRRSSAGPETDAQFRGDSRRPSVTTSHQNLPSLRVSGGPSSRLVQPTVSSTRRNSLVTDGTGNESSRGSLRQAGKQSNVRDKLSTSSQGVSQNGQASQIGQTSVGKRRQENPVIVPSVFSLIGLAPPASTFGKRDAGLGIGKASEMTVEEWALQSSGQWHQLGSSTASEHSTEMVDTRP